MKRCLAKLVLFLLLGAIVNIAVACALVLFSPVTHQQWMHGGLIYDQPHPIYWRTTVVRLPGALLVDAAAWRSKKVPPVNPQLPSWSATRNPPLHTGVFNIREIAYGWPMLTVYSRVHGWTPKDPFPNNPIWMGVAVNSIAYALLVAGATMGFQAIGFRRRSRIKRGLCPACAYPVGQSPTCTECGAAVTPVV